MERFSRPGRISLVRVRRRSVPLENGKTTQLRTALKLPANAWLHLRLAHDGHIWIRGSLHVGEVIPAENQLRMHDLPGRSNVAPYAELTEEPMDDIVASQGAAFGLLEDGRWRMVTSANGLTRYDISELFVDREGSLWIGVVGHGLMRWVGQQKWEAYTEANGLSDDIVWATLRDRTGRLWIGTESGLDVLAPGTTDPKPWQKPGILVARSSSLVDTADGSVWMGSRGWEPGADRLQNTGRKRVEGTRGLLHAERRRSWPLGGYGCRALPGGHDGRRPLPTPG